MADRPAFRMRLPHWHYFEFPPSQIPLTVPASTDGRDFAAPFGIDPEFYRAALDWKVPITFALVYATTVTLLNAVNRSRSQKPWYISKTWIFHILTLLHNIALAVFSGLTFIGMLRVLAHSWPGLTDTTVFGKDWPSLRTQNGLAGAADALCHMHGPRGYGDAVYFDTNRSQWTSKNTLIRLLENEPDATDVGRIWNEGLAFWGFWFYMSKFYEVVDTLIILAKGKRSSTLQTYHHAGAMMCMWAGIRFMSPPIWMFVFINSGIHTLMYTYYTLTTLRIRVPKAIKQTITSMQIAQFLIGMTFAGLHLFVEYDVPVNTPYTVTHTITSVLSEATQSASSVISEAASSITASVGVAQMLKKMALRAAGEEGLAENVLDKRGRHFGAHAPIIPQIIKDHLPNFRETFHQETQYRTTYETMDCIETQGQAFAIYLNILYLLPLTGLFLRFFVKSYLRFGSEKAGSTGERRLSRSLYDAAKDVEREFNAVGKKAEDEVAKSADLDTTERSQPQTPASDKKKKKHKSPKKSTSQGNLNNSQSSLSQSVENAVQQGKAQLQKAKDAVVDTASDAKKTASDELGGVSLKDVTNKAADAVNEVASEGKALVDDVKDKAEKATQEVEKKQEQASKKADSAADSKNDKKPEAKKPKNHLDESAVIVDATKIEPLKPETTESMPVVTPTKKKEEHIIESPAKVHQGESFADAVKMAATPETPKRTTSPSKSSRLPRPKKDETDSISSSKGSIKALNVSNPYSLLDDPSSASP